MTPRSDLSSTGYALAKPGAEYLILQPDGEPFTAKLASGNYVVNWHDITSRSTGTGDQLTVPNDEPITFTIPPTVNDPAVLHLKRIDEL